MAHKRHHTDTGPTAINLGLIITPMLDMAFQILAFFIMTYHPSALEGHIPGSLVPPEEVAKKGPQNNANPNQEALSVNEEDLLPELNEAIQVKIKAIGKDQQIGNRLEGMPSQLYIKQAADTQAVEIAGVDVDWDVALKRLDQKLKDLLKEGATTKANIKIEGDTDLRQQYIMAVYDTCKKAGFGKLHFVPPPVLKTKLMR